MWQKDAKAIDSVTFLDEDFHSSKLINMSRTRGIHGCTMVSPWYLALFQCLQPVQVLNFSRCNVWHATIGILRLIPHMFHQHVSKKNLRSHQPKTIKNHQKPSKTIKNHQKPSKTIKNHQKPSKTIKNHQKPQRLQQNWAISHGIFTNCPHLCPMEAFAQQSQSTLFRQLRIEDLQQDMR